MTLQTGNGSTALHYAAQYDKVDIVKYFLGALDGTEGLVDIANASGQTALHVAARHGKDKTVEALISFNANTLLLDKIGRSAEALAEEFKFPVVVTLLQEAAVAQREAQVSSAELELKNVRLPRPCAYIHVAPLIPSTALCMRFATHALCCVSRPQHPEAPASLKADLLCVLVCALACVSVCVWGGWWWCSGVACMSTYLSDRRRRLRWSATSRNRSMR